MLLWWFRSILLFLFLESFSTLYPSKFLYLYCWTLSFLVKDASITPKMHHLLHLPEQILRFGPLRLTWCMRFESKNKEMKGYVSRCNCAKNVPFTASIKHQLSQCSNIAKNNFFYGGDEVLGGSCCIIDEQLSHLIVTKIGITVEVALKWLFFLTCCFHFP
jgi:hypothetical protein